MPRPENLGKRKYKAYSDDEQMQNAVDDVRQGRGSCKAVALRYGINRTTLLNHIKGYKCQAVGRPTVLTKEEEELLVHSLVKLGEWGFGFDRLQLQLCVQDYLTRVDRINPFKNNLPGVDWCVAFEKRWKKEISRRVAQNLPKNRALAGASEIMDNFHTILMRLYDECQLHNRPQNIFNCDETGFQTDVGKQKVICRRGSRNPFRVVGSTTKATYTVLMCCSATGDYLPMFINYKGLHLYSNWCTNGPENARYNCSPSGWMESAQFLDWFVNLFIPSTSHLEGKKLLILDGHNSHISLQLIDKAKENNIELLCLPAHTSHLLQPLDVGVYKAVKQAWRVLLRDFYKETSYKNVDKVIFPSLMKKLAETGCLSRSNAIGGFEGSGIYPLSLEKMKRKIETASIVSEEQSSDSLTPRSTTVSTPGIPSTEQQAGPSTSSLVSTPKSSISNYERNQCSSEDVTPRKSLELALMAVLKTRNESSPSPRKKRSKLSRKFAESLTTEEVRERLAKNEETKKTKLMKKKTPLKSKKSKKSESSSDSEVSVQLESDDDVSDYIGLGLDDDGDEDIQNINQEIPPQDSPPRELDEIAVDKYIIAEFTSAKGKAHYAGRITEEKDNNITVNFLRKRGLYFTYPDVSDEAQIKKQDVIKVLNDPFISRGRHYFEINGLPAGVILF